MKQPNVLLILAVCRTTLRNVKSQILCIFLLHGLQNSQVIIVALMTLFPQTIMPADHTLLVVLPVLYFWDNILNTALSIVIIRPPQPPPPPPLQFPLLRPKLRAVRLALAVIVFPIPPAPGDSLLEIVLVFVQLGSPPVLLVYIAGNGRAAQSTNVLLPLLLLQLRLVPPQPQLQDRPQPLSPVLGLLGFITTAVQQTQVVQAVLYQVTIQTQPAPPKAKPAAFSLLLSQQPLLFLLQPLLPPPLPLLSVLRGQPIQFQEL